MSAIHSTLFKEEKVQVLAVYIQMLDKLALQLQLLYKNHY